MPRAGSIKERHSRRDGTGGYEVDGMDDEDDEDDKDDIADDVSPSNSTSGVEDSSKDVRSPFASLNSTLASSDDDEDSKSSALSPAMPALSVSPITTTCWSSRGAVVSVA